MAKHVQYQKITLIQDGLYDFQSILEIVDGQLNHLLPDDKDYHLAQDTNTGEYWFSFKDPKSSQYYKACSIMIQKDGSVEINDLDATRFRVSIQ